MQHYSLKVEIPKPVFISSFDHFTKNTFFMALIAIFFYIVTSSNIGSNIQFVPWSQIDAIKKASHLNKPTSL